MAQREVVQKSIAEVKKRFPKGVPLLDPIEDMGVKDVKFKELVAVRFASYLLITIVHSFL